jgi:hypothetical protein
MWLPCCVGESRSSDRVRRHLVDNLIAEEGPSSLISCRWISSSPSSLQTKYTFGIWENVRIPNKLGGSAAHGLPSLPRTTPEAVFCWAASSPVVCDSREPDVLPDGKGNDICSPTRRTFLSRCGGERKAHGLEIKSQPCDEVKGRYIRCEVYLRGFSVSPTSPIHFPWSSSTPSI